MANLSGTPDFGSVYQLETNDPVIGGAPNLLSGAGKSNIPHLQLLNMALWLRDKIDASGVGLEASVLIVNWDTVTKNGTYRAGAGAIGAPLAGAFFIGQHHTSGDASAAWQMVTSVVDGRTFSRVRAAGVWGGWTELWTTAQTAFSAGFSGYLRLPNGLIKQWGRIATPASASTAVVDVVFPISFPTTCFGAVASIGVQITDYDSNPSIRLCRSEVSIGIPTNSGVEMQAFMDNFVNETRIVHWSAIGN